MAYHETRLAPGDPGEGPLGQVIAYIDDDGKTHYPGGKGYVEPDEGFLQDFAADMADDQQRVQDQTPAPPPGAANDGSQVVEDSPPPPEEDEAVAPPQ